MSYEKKESPKKWKTTIAIPSESKNSKSGYEVESNILQSAREAITCLDDNDEDEADECRDTVSCSNNHLFIAFLSYRITMKFYHFQFICKYVCI